MTIEAMCAIADILAASHLGYDQGQRWTHFDKKRRKVVPKGECDCSSSCGTILWLGGYPIDLSGTFYTGNFVSKVKAAGYHKIISVKGWSQTKLFNYVKKGDVLLGPGHVIFVREGGPKGKWWSAETDERGRSSGGKTGAQPGESVGYRRPYMRSRGWTYLMRPYPSTKYRGEILARYEDGGSWGKSMEKLKTTAPVDGPMWDDFMKELAKLDRGMKLAYSANALVDVPNNGHVFVVLGSALKSDGSLPQKYIRRLKLTLDAANKFPNSMVLISGGAPKNGITEGAAGKKWLIDNGLAESRIKTEERSSSTIGNAKNSLIHLLGMKATSYTLISDASHLRRAQILFNTADLSRATAINQRLNIKPLQALAFNDYGSKPVAVEKTMTQTTRTEIVKEVAYLLGLTAQWGDAR